MTATEAHAVTFRIQRRAHLDTLKTPTCATCGDLTPAPIDAHEADVVRKRHVQEAAIGAVTG